MCHQHDLEVYSASGILFLRSEWYMRPWHDFEVYSASGII